MSLFKEYISERKGYECVELEEGFASYFIKDKECYVEDVFVKAEARRKGVATQLMNSVSMIAIEAGCEIMTVTVVPSTNGSTESLKASLFYGFKLKACHHNVILLEKEL